MCSLVGDFTMKNQSLQVITRLNILVISALGIIGSTGCDPTKMQENQPSWMRHVENAEAALERKNVDTAIEETVVVLKLAEQAGPNGPVPPNLALVDMDEFHYRINRLNAYKRDDCRVFSGQARRLARKLVVAGQPEYAEKLCRKALYFDRNKPVPSIELGLYGIPAVAACVLAQGKLAEATALIKEAYKVTNGGFIPEETDVTSESDFY